MQNLTIQDLIILSSGISQYKKAYGTTEAVKQVEKKIHQAIIKTDIEDDTTRGEDIFNSIVEGTENAPLK